MLTRPEFIRKSLETNLFFLRIMKEHMLFMEAGFVCKDVHLIQQAECLKNAANALLAEAVCLANGVISREAVASQEFVTDNTLAAEQKTQNLSGIPIDTNLTRAELALMGNGNLYSPQLESAVYCLNQKAIALSARVIQFKGIVINAVLSCNIFTTLFPLLLDHIRREIIFYNMSLTRLQSGQDPEDPAMAAQLEAFWNRIMAEHSLFIRNLLDPTEKSLFETAQSFANEFEKLTSEAETAKGKPAIEKVTRQSLTATKSIRDFKKQGTELLLICKIKSIIIPLLGDHVTREANYYLRLLKQLEEKGC